MRQIQKKLKDFCVKNDQILGEKHIGLFICCGLPESFKLICRINTLFTMPVDKESPFY
jgi:hypothetical protein